MPTRKHRSTFLLFVFLWGVFIILSSDYIYPPRTDPRGSDSNGRHERVPESEPHHGINGQQQINRSSAAQGRVPSRPGETGSCTPTHHFAFIKTHKCASDTLAVHLMHIAEERGLEMVTPTGEWNLHWPHPPGRFFKSRKPSGRFDATALHMMYERGVWDRFMEPGTKYFSILRQPFDQFKSYFNYMRVWEVMERRFRVNQSRSFHVFLSNPRRFLVDKQWYNPMAVDLGYRSAPAGADAAFLRKMQEEMDVMLIADYFDESMLLLRHHFCWSMRDVIYKPWNIGRGYGHGENDAPPQLQQLQRSRYASFAVLDHALYDAFNATFWERVNAIPRFQEQLAQYKKVLARTWMFCKTKPLLDSVKYVIPRCEFHERMVIDKAFCERISLNLWQYIGMMKARYNQSSPRYGNFFPDDAEVDAADNDYGS